ncbi:hypothetical protein L1887_53921 [Cichorium endivia]|nr:hypothetical protein L1887_53921 [Cichorium endivia]
MRAPKSANARAAALSAAAESDDQKVELKASLSDSAGHLSRLTHSAAGRKSHKLLSRKKGGDAINALHAQPCASNLFFRLDVAFPAAPRMPSCTLRSDFRSSSHPPEPTRSFLHPPLPHRHSSLPTALVCLPHRSRRCLCRYMLVWGRLLRVSEVLVSSSRRRQGSPASVPRCTAIRRQRDANDHQAQITRVPSCESRQPQCETSASSRLT